MNNKRLEICVYAVINVGDKLKYKNKIKKTMIKQK